MPETDLPVRSLTVSGMSAEVYELGSGPPLLFLHPHTGSDPRAAVLQHLARHWTVIAPSHPGFGRTELPAWMKTVDDLSYFYLDLMEMLDLRNVTLVGASLGGWIAAEIAVKSAERLSRLVLADPVGIRLGGPEATDIFDIFVAAQKDVDKRLYRDPKFALTDLSALSEEEAFIMFRSRESTALFGWSPYMHNPNLRHWLHRIRIPALVLHGENDGITSAEYARAFAAQMPSAKFQTIEESGHFPHIEEPARFAECILHFAKQSDSIAA
ncbi:MAG: alpha/beta hydrolase fold protein [Rhodospirillales bacterium]|nr:alpha/beta hydrolase fold protein [Rhodospirillales bacterium]